METVSLRFARIEHAVFEMAKARSAMMSALRLARRHPGFDMPLVEHATTLAHYGWNAIIAIEGTERADEWR